MNQVENLAKLLLPKKMDTQNALKIESPEFTLTKISHNSTLLAVYENSHPIVGIQLTRRELVQLMGLMDYYCKSCLLIP